MNEKKCCENCGNEICKNMIVAILYDTCLDSGYELYWKPKSGTLDKESMMEKHNTHETRPHIPQMPGRSEADEQIAVITWAMYMTSKWPILERLYHTPNGGYRNAAEAVQLKRMGVKPGVPDLFLPYPCGGWSGLWLEMKTDKGHPTACQRDWIKYLRSVGYCAYVCHSAGEAINAIEDYLRMEYEDHVKRVARLRRQLEEAMNELAAARADLKSKMKDSGKE